MDAFLQSGTVEPLTEKRRILIVDDHTFFAACLRTLLDNESDLVVCDIMASSTLLRERVERLRPHLLVIDLSLGAENGIDVGQRLRAMQIGTPILFVSSMQAPTAEQLATVPRSAFIAKSRTPADFLTALRAILAPNAAEPSSVEEEMALVRMAAKA